MTRNGGLPSVRRSGPLPTTDKSGFVFTEVVAEPPSGRGHRVRRLAGYLGVCALGILIGLFSVIIANGGSLLIPPVPAPGYVFFDGVQIDFFYLNGTPQLFGPNEQQACGNCPINLTGGTTFSMSDILNLVFPPNSTTTYSLNATSPIPFEEWECSWSGARPPGWPPTGCPFVTDWSETPTIVETGSGEFSITYPLTLQIPDPAPNLPGGFELQIVVSASMVPGNTPLPSIEGARVG